VIELVYDQRFYHQGLEKSCGRSRHLTEHDGARDACPHVLCDGRTARWDIEAQSCLACLLAQCAQKRKRLLQPATNQLSVSLPVFFFFLVLTDALLLQAPEAVTITVAPGVGREASDGTVTAAKTPHDCVACLAPPSIVRGTVDELMLMPPQNMVAVGEW